ncbi:MAG: 1-acyl-sn-glycerol-3-phosphate acyltransferase [Treponemataceae bacterium]|nr:MAG: 1-acyl-sn-glycerol-3-phosphate acyltransferase [Treponemataceae bacterium]
MPSIKERYSNLFSQLQSFSHAAPVIDETNVYQEANPAPRVLMDKVTAENLLAGSRLEGIEHFEEFYNRVAGGKSGLILMEHYSNMDLPELCYFLRNVEKPFGKELEKRLVAIAGMKLNEADPIVRSWAEAFSRIVIYPTRTLASQNVQEEEERARKINMAAMRAMDAAKKRGEVILVFPSGTRYRKGKPETKKGLREIDSYFRLFDVMLLVSINGNLLEISDAHPDDMLEDIINPNKVIFAASPVIDCKKFRSEVLEAKKGAADLKQETVDAVMRMLDDQHEHYEKIRLEK